MLTSSKLTAGRKTKGVAQAHLIYTTNDVLELLDIVPNTLTAWKKLGLSCVRSTSDLYLGQDISQFLKWNKQQRRVPLEKTEVYCVHCKHKHSLHEHQYRVIHNEAGSHHLALTCPNTGKEAHRFISPNELRLIESEFNRKSRTDQEDYNVDQAGSKIAISSAPQTVISNSGNLILRYEYQLFLKQVEGFSTKTIIAICRHIAQFDEYLQHVDYKSVLRDQVIAYKTKLESKLVTSEREQRSASTIVHSLINLKKFFHWLESKTSVKLSCFGVGDYFSPSRELSALASVPTKGHPIPTLEQMRHFITSMPDSNFIERRNRAIIALLMISALRIDALLSLHIQHIDIENRSIFQDARIVKTKNKKTMWTKWFPVDDNSEAIVTNWVNEVIEKGAKPTDPLFLRALDPIRRMYEPDYMAPLMDQGTVRSIIKQHCALVGLPYFNPHSLRKTITLAGDEFCKNSKQRKAWSQNLGHEHMSTTDQYYGKLDTDEQFSVMDDIRDHSQSKQAIELQSLISRLSQEQIDLITNLARQCVGKGEKV